MRSTLVRRSSLSLKAVVKHSCWNIWNNTVKTETVLKHQRGIGDRIAKHRLRRGIGDWIAKHRLRRGIGDRIAKHRLRRGIGDRIAKHLLRRGIGD